jgi:hypothetical protein
MIQRTKSSPSTRISDVAVLYARLRHDEMLPQRHEDSDLKKTTTELKRYDCAGHVAHTNTQMR